MCPEKDTVQVFIDLMTKEDIPEILEIEKQSFALPWTEGMFTHEFSLPHSQCLVARINQGERSIVGGYIIFWIVADEAHLHNLAVRKEYCRQGLARNFMTMMKDIAGQIGLSAQTLEVRESNTAAINLYRKCGFVVKGRRPLYYTDPDEDALIMWADVK
jgi:[ribosomal protein S18]-alanine N-acetyltransferase